MKGFLGLPLRWVALAAGLAIGAGAWVHPRGTPPGFLVAISAFAFLWSITRAYFRLRTRFSQEQDSPGWGGSLWTTPVPASREGNFFCIALLFLSAGVASMAYSYPRGYDPLFGAPLVAVGLGQLVGIGIFRRFQRNRAK